MNTMTSRHALTARFAFAALIAFTLSIGFCLITGTASAYADDGLSAAGADVPAASIVDPSDDTVPVEGGGALTAMEGEGESDPVPNEYGDDGTAGAFIDLVPVSSSGFTLLPYDPTLDYPEDETPNPDASFPRDVNNGVHAYYSTQVGEGVDLTAVIDYFRVGTTTSSPSGGDVSLLYDDNHYNYFLISWYWGEPPLPQGSYTSDPAMLSEGSAVSGGSGGASSIRIPDVNINPMAFIFDYANSYYENRNEAFSINGRIGFSWVSANMESIYIPTGASECASYQSALFFNYKGWERITAQATYVQETWTRASLDGEPVLYATYTVYASNPVYFHIFVDEAPTAALSLTAEDDMGNEVVLNSSDFYITLSKEYKISSDSDTAEYAQCAWSSTYEHATAGNYILSVRHRDGLYNEYKEEFTLSDSDIASGATAGIVKHLKLVESDPIFYTVKFVNDDEDETVIPVTVEGEGGATTLVDSREYRATTMGSRVIVPTEKPTKAEDEDYRYAFDTWEIKERSGLRTKTPLDVTSDMTYKAVFRKIPKKDVKVVKRIYATGGLFAIDKPAGVTSYGLDVEEPSAEERATILEDHKAYLGSGDIVGVFKVDLIAYGDDDSETSITEGVGDLTLSFPTDGLADGAKVKVIQLHEGSGGIEVIEHPGLTVSGGRVDVSLKDKLSTFIIVQDDGTTNSADEPTNVEPASTDPTSTEPAGTDPTNVEPSSTEPVGEEPAAEEPAATEPANSVSERVSPAVEAAGGQMAVAVGESATDGESLSVTRAAAIDMVKTGEDSDAAETRDVSAMEMLAFGATLAFMVMMACAIRRRETE